MDILSVADVHPTFAQKHTSKNKEYLSYLIACRSFFLFFFANFNQLSSCDSWRVKKTRKHGLGRCWLKISVYFEWPVVHLFTAPFRHRLLRLAGGRLRLCSHVIKILQQKNEMLNEKCKIHFIHIVPHIASTTYTMHHVIVKMTVVFSYKFAIISIHSHRAASV